MAEVAAAAKAPLQAGYLGPNEHTIYVRASPEHPDYAGQVWAVSSARARNFLAREYVNPETGRPWWTDVSKMPEVVALAVDCRDAQGLVDYEIIELQTS